MKTKDSARHDALVRRINGLTKIEREAGGEEREEDEL